MKEVSCWPLANLLVSLRDAGLDEASLWALTHGLDVSFADCLSPRRRISWDEFTTILDRVTGVVGGLEPLQRFARRASVRATGALGTLAGSLISPRPLYILGVRTLGPFLFSCTRGVYEDLPDGRVRQAIEILPGYRDSLPFFYCMNGIARGVPAWLGLGEPDVAMAVYERMATYTITLPRPLSLRERRAAPEPTIDEVLSLGFHHYVIPVERGGPIEVIGHLTALDIEGRDGSGADQDLFVRSVREQIVVAIEQQNLSLKCLAASLSMSTRTLVRRLAVHGTSFQALTEEVRRELAERLLEDGRSIGEIAYMLCFSDSTSFHRAFKRWTGRTPTEFSRSQNL